MYPKPFYVLKGIIASSKKARYAGPLSRLLMLEACVTVLRKMDLHDRARSVRSFIPALRPFLRPF